MAVTSCSDPATCGNFGDGHRTHPIRGRRAGETPWGWRDGVVASASGGRVVVRYLAEDGEVVAEHHRTLPLTDGDPVRLHEQYRLLAGPDGWFCVALEGGLGPVPAPNAPDVWSPEANPGIVDLATGDGVATDHRDA